MCRRICCSPSLPGTLYILHLKGLYSVRANVSQLFMLEKKKKVFINLYLFEVWRYAKRKWWAWLSYEMSVGSAALLRDRQVYIVNCWRFHSLSSFGYIPTYEIVSLELCCCSGLMLKKRILMFLLRCYHWIKVGKCYRSQLHVLYSHCYK